MKKFLLIPSLILFFAGSAFGQSFSDISQSHPYYTAISYLKIKEIINGYSDSTFRPYEEINRAELLKIFMESSGKEISEPTIKCFTDVDPAEWYAKYICSAKNQGIVNGYSDGSFKPGTPINKVESLSMLAETYNWQLSNNPSSINLYIDTPDDLWYAPLVAYAKSKNLLEETGTLLSPSDFITRANISSILYKQLAITEIGHDSFTEATNEAIEEKYNIESEDELLQITPNDIKIELSWQNSDVDLDLHLIKPLIVIDEETEEEVLESEEIYYYNKYSQDDSSYLVQTDNTEIITIENLEEGTYYIFVDLYDGDISFSYAGAQVKLYQDNVLLKTFSPLADPDSEKTIWNLLEISKLGDIKVINEVDNTRPI